MSEINDLYKIYFQKSKVFLYPTLNIIRNNNFIPINTYLSWNDEINITSGKLICLYETVDNTEFKYFEENLLLNNKLFDICYKINESKSVYIFNINEKDWKNFIGGKYSKLSNNLKDKIIKFYRNNGVNSIYIDSFLYPKDYYSKYSKLLTTNSKDAKKMEKLLNTVGELCDPPNLKKEQLVLIPEDLKIKDI